MLSSDLPYPLLSNPDSINITEEVDIVVILLYMIYIMSLSNFSADVCSSVVLLSWFYINLNSRLLLLCVFPGTEEDQMITME